MKQILRYLLALWLIFVGFLFGVTELKAQGAPRITAGDEIRPDTICFGTPVTLFLQEFSGNILRWEKSEDGGIVWQPIANTTRSLSQSPIIRTTHYRAVLKVGNNPETYSQMKRVVPFDYKIKTVLWNSSKRGHRDSDTITGCGYDYNGYRVTLSWAYSSQRIIINNYFNLQFREDGLTDWKPAYSGYSINYMTYDSLTNSTEQYSGIVLNNSQEIMRIVPGKTSVVRWVRLAYDSPCGKVYTDEKKVTIIFPEPVNPVQILKATDFGMSQDKICFDEPFKVWLKNKPQYRGGWYSLNLKQDTIFGGLSSYLVNDPQKNSCFEAGTTYCVSDIFNQRYNGTIKDTITFGADWLIWGETMYDEAYFQNYKAQAGRDLELLLYARSYVEYLCNGRNTEVPANSELLRIPVSLPTLGGRVKATTYLCAGTAPPKLNLVNHRGKVLFWESSVDGKSWTRINTTDTIFTPPALTQTTYFRAQVQNNNCSVQPSIFARVVISPETKAGTLIGKATACPRQPAPIITLRGQVGQVDHWETSFDGQNWTSVAHIATNYKPDTILQDMWFRASIISPGCSPVMTDAFKVTYLSALDFNIPAIQGPRWVCTTDLYINLTLPVDPSLVVQWEYNDCCAKPGYWENLYGGGKSDLKYAFIKNCCCTAKSTVWFRAKIRYSNFCDDVYTVEYPVDIYCCPIVTECRGVNLIPCPNPWLCVGEQLKLEPAASVIPFFNRWEYAETDANNQWVWRAVPNSVPNYVSHKLTKNTCFRNVAVINGREFFSEQFCVRVLPDTRPGYLTQDRTICKGQNSDTLRLMDFLGEIKIWQQSTDSNTWTDIIHSDSIYQSQALQQTTWFRTAVRLCNEKCALSYSRPVKITVLNFDETKGGKTVAVFDSVCSGGKPKLRLENHRGSVVYWQETDPTDVTFARAKRYNVFDSQLEGDAITTNKVYRAVVKNSDCETKFSEPVTVKVGNVSFFAKIGGSLNICPQQQAILRIESRKGEIERWEVDLTGNNVWTPINIKTDTLETPVVMTASARFRVVLKLPGCALKTSAIVTVKTDAAPRGGTVSGDNTACIINDGQQTIYPSAVFTLTGHTGNIVRWQTSVDGGTTWRNQSISSATFTLSNATQTTRVRAVVQLNGCNEVLSTNVGLLTVLPALNVGIVSAQNRTVCSGTKAYLSLTGLNGTVAYWEKTTSEFSPAQTVRINSTDALLETDALNVDTKFRAVVTTSCGIVPTNAVTIVVTSLGYNGYISTNGTGICRGSTAELILNNNQGNIIRWEYQVSNTNNWVTIAQTASRIVTPPLTQNTYFRAITRWAGCEEIPSQSKHITVSDVSSNIIASPQTSTLCAGYDNRQSVTINLSQSDIPVRYWQMSRNEGAIWEKLSYQSSNLNQFVNVGKTWFRSVMGLIGCDSAFSSISKFELLPTLQIGKLKASAYYVCKENPAPVLLELKQADDSIIRWEQAIGCGGNWTPIPNIEPTYLVENIREQTCFRVLVANRCRTDYSPFVAISVAEQPTVTKPSISDPFVCMGTVVNLGVPNTTASFVEWQTSSNGNTWRNIPRAEGIALQQRVTERAYYRAVVSLEGCGQNYSEPVFVEVRPQPVSGNIDAPQSVCRGNSVTLKLTGQNKRIIRWQSSKSQDWTNPTAIYNTASTLLISEQHLTTSYRAVLEGCMEDEIIYSPTVTISVDNCLTCHTPVGFRISESKSDRMTVTWSSVKPGSSYEVSYRIVNTNTWTTLPLTQQLSQTITGLMTCKQYEVRLRAFCDNAFTDYAPVMFATTTVQAPTPVISAVSDQNATVSWSSVSPSAVYQLRYRIRNTTNWTLTSTIAGQTSRTLIGLKKATSYEVQMRCACEVNQPFPDWTNDNPVIFTTGQPIFLCTERKPSAPYAVTVSKIKNNSAVVRWQNIPDTKGTVVVYGLASASPATWTQMLVCSSTDSLIMNGLAPGKTYRVRVRTLCENCLQHSGTSKKSDWSPVLDFKTITQREEDGLNLETSNEISLYPNPNKGSFYLRIEAPIENTSLNLELYSLTGQRIWQEVRTNISNEIAVQPEGLSAGTYLLKVHYGTTFRTLRLMVD